MGTHHTTHITGIPASSGVAFDDDGLDREGAGRRHADAMRATVAGLPEQEVGAPADDGPGRLTADEIAAMDEVWAAREAAREAADAGDDARRAAMRRCTAAAAALAAAKAAAR